MRLTFELDDAEVIAAIDEALASLQRPREMFEAVGAVLEQNINLRFQTKIDPEGNAWAPLAPATLEIYASDWFIKQNPEFKGGTPGTLLQRTNRMLQSLAYNADNAGLEVGFSRSTKGEKWQVALLHEFGTEKMPRRGILTADPKEGRLGEQDQADVLDAIRGSLGRLFGA
jgi:phage gpG-like protein